MKKSMLLKAAAVLTMLMLALVITGVPGKSLALISGVTITPNAGESYTIPIGGTVHLTAVNAGTTTGTVTYGWAQGSLTNVSLSATSGATTTVTGLIGGTSTTITVTATDNEAPGASYQASVTINVTAMTISTPSISLNGGATQTLTVGNVSSGSTTLWTSSNTNVATVNFTTGLVTAVGGGSATIFATNTSTNGSVQAIGCAVSVTPIITITPAAQNITAANTAASIQLKVEYGGDLVTTASTVSWGNSNATAGSLTVAPTTFTNNSGVLTATATFLSNSTGVNASSTVTATIAGAASFTASKTSNVDVRTARYLSIEGDSTLSNTDRYGDYTITLREANGTIVNDDTSTAHWSWSSSYLSVSNADLNDNRAKMTDGVAKIQLYARYNTPSSGTRIYAWINSDSGNKIYTTVVITGLSSLPQTGQDMTLIYVLGGTAAAFLAAAGVWYGIRKKRTVA